MRCSERIMVRGHHFCIRSIETNLYINHHLLLIYESGSTILTIKRIISVWTFVSSFTESTLRPVAQSKRYTREWAYRIVFGKALHLMFTHTLSFCTNSRLLKWCSCVVSSITTTNYRLYDKIECSVDWNVQCRNTRFDYWSALVCQTASVILFCLFNLGWLRHVGTLPFYELVDLGLVS